MIYSDLPIILDPTGRQEIRDVTPPRRTRRPDLADKTPDNENADFCNLTDVAQKACIMTSLGAVGRKNMHDEEYEELSQRPTRDRVTSG